MQGDDKHINDLDYLSQQGFEKISVTDADLKDLVKKVKARSFSYNNGMYFAFIGLMLGIFIGVSLFFIITPEPRPALPGGHAPDASDALPAIPAKKPGAILLDTLTVIHDNFIDPHAKPVIAEKVITESGKEQLVDSVMTIPEKPIDVALFNKARMQEATLKFIANAPVIYIHDLKVTNYTVLYFRKNHFIELTGRPGLSADYASKTGMGQPASQLKHEADYFLHEEVSQALLAFKKGKYDKCINSLNLIATYNDTDINCDFYLAMCYYYKHTYTKAIGLFDACIGNMNNTFLQEAEYYKAVSLFEAGNKAEALTAFKQIVDEEGFYSEKAKGYLR